MKKCIYSLKDEKDATFNKREHILSAGLGSRKTLDLGYVSDTINEKFSRLELLALRYSWLAINRRNNGPGKRGNANVFKINNPLITINQYEKNGNESNNDIQYASNRLGFSFYGKLYTIPQIIFPIRKDCSIQIPRILFGNSNDKENADFIKFMINLNNPAAEMKFVKIESNLSFVEDFITIGMFNRKIFVFTTKNDRYIQWFLSAINDKSLPEQIVGFYPSDGEYLSSTYEKKLFDDSYIFLYAKTAFNALAFLEGQQFVLKEEFDHIRESILNNTNLREFTCFNDLPKWLKKWAKESLPLRAHYVVIATEFNSLNAYVGFYGERPMIINLTNQYIGKKFKNFFICDYLNNNEYYNNIPSK